MLGAFLVIVACLFWGMDTLIRYPLVETGVNPITIVFYEHLVLTIAFSLGIIPAIRRMGELRIGDIVSFLVIGGVGSALGTVAFTESFQYLNPSLVILLQKLQPVVAIFLAAIILKEQIEKQFLIWAAVCLIGGFMVSFPDLSRFYQLMVNDLPTATSAGATRGYMLVGISIVGWGATTVFGKKLTMKGFDTKTIMGGRFLMGFIALLPFVNWNHKLLLPNGEDYLKILIMVLISGAAGMYFYYQGLKRISAKTAAIAEMFFPFFAIVLNWIFLGKELSEIQLFGGMLLIIGSLIIQLKKY